MKKIAICGNIASGKSTAQKIIENKGYKVLDTDEVSHKLLTVKNIPLYEAFKGYDVFENGEFSRYKTGKLIFANDTERAKISSIMHPQIRLEIQKFFDQNKNETLLFVGIPLLFETGMENLFDKIIFIYADDNIRLERLIKRNNYPVEHAKARMNSQIPQDKKINHSDFVIKNNGTREEFKSNILEILNLLSET